jgi:HEAT repeat protein
VAETMVPASKDPIADAIRGLVHPLSWIRARAAATLADLLLGNRLDRRAIEPLINSLHDSHRKVRLHAVQALRNCPDVRAGEPLIAVLLDRDPDIRGAACTALGRIREPRAVVPLIQRLRDSDPGVRSSAAEALHHLGDPRAIPYLMDLLHDQNSLVRWSVTTTLGRLSATDATEALLLALQDLDSSVRSGAASALGKLKATQAVPQLLLALMDVSWGVRHDAAEALGLIGDARAIPALIRLLGDNDERDADGRVPAIAMQALARIGSPAVQPLLDALDDLDPWRRGWVIQTLGRIGDPQTVAAVLQCAADQDQQIHRAVHWALADFDRRLRHLSNDIHNESSDDLYRLYRRLLNE